MHAQKCIEMDKSDLIQKREVNALSLEANSKLICCRDEVNALDDRETNSHDLERSPCRACGVVLTLFSLPCR